MSREVIAERRVGASLKEGQLVRAEKEERRGRRSVVVVVGDGRVALLVLSAWLPFLDMTLVDTCLPSKLDTHIKII